MDAGLIKSEGKKEKWKRIKSKGKKLYILKSILLFGVFVSLFFTVYVIFYGQTIFSNLTEVIVLYFVCVIVNVPLGIWAANNSWNANIRRFDK
ncbi:hypothetical protein [Bacillus sp. EB01]|uniref:hypothetical protein n=1 Tax=Bacillus sp. EB01 TaxID=1347086 RepID=UPI0005C711BD|nr:hypothetical protein [Bacillus sp. EB01]